MALHSFLSFLFMNRVNLLLLKTNQLFFLQRLIMSAYIQDRTEEMTENLFPSDIIEYLVRLNFVSIPISTKIDHRLRGESFKTLLWSNLVKRVRNELRHTFQDIEQS